MKRFIMIVVLISVVAGCGGDAGKGANPGVPVEWNKSPDAPKGYGDPSKSVSTGRPEKGGPRGK